MMWGMETITPKLLSWASILDWATREQAIKTASMPFIHPYLALMPDAHLGKGATVGSVIPTRGAIMPAAVGVDIGCGMCAWRTDVNRAGLDNRDLHTLREYIEHSVPLSPGNYNQQWWKSQGTKRRVAELEQLDGIDSAEAVAPNWRLQLGSLGGGNHFIETTADEDGWLWLFLHSGSRGVGNKLASKHIKIARDLCKAQNVRLPDADLAYLTEGTDEFAAYICDLRWAQRFAWLNRDEMMERVHEVFGAWLKAPFEVTERVNCHHNYTEQEVHGDELVWLSRKGAIDATAGTPGLIPGSMSAASYVVTGKGNAQAFNSSPHGAGRIFSRSKAKQQFTEADLQESMKGIEWRRDSGRAFLDEISGAYKPIDQVMADSDDLVEIRHELHQLVNVKGE
jgi:tRNA-splicing ligase RtcB (3'-phosphate/5'-hydroxy nucleic acid ligase)